MAKLTFTDQSYFSRDWAMLTRDKGWLKPILLMALASLVPIVGILGVTGYAYEWARLTAWGVDSAPKQRDVKIGACIKSGFRVSMVTLCWSLVAGLVFSALNMLCGDSALGSIVSMLTTLLTWVVGVLATVAALQATIYERFGAGFAVRRLVEMVRRGWKGLLKVLGINILIALVSGLIGTVVTLIAGAATLPFLGTFLYDVSYAANAADLGTIDSPHLRSPRGRHDHPRRSAWCLHHAADRQPDRPVDDAVRRPQLGLPQRPAARLPSRCGCDRRGCRQSRRGRPRPHGE